MFCTACTCLCVSFQITQRISINRYISQCLSPCYRHLSSLFFCVRVWRIDFRSIFFVSFRFGFFFHSLIKLNYCILFTVCSLYYAILLLFDLNCFAAVVVDDGAVTVVAFCMSFLFIFISVSFAVVHSF